MVGTKLTKDACAPKPDRIVPAENLCAAETSRAAPVSRLCG